MAQLVLISMFWLLSASYILCTMGENETGISSLHVFVPIVVVIHVGLQFGSGYKRARRVENKAL